MNVHHFLHHLYGFRTLLAGLVAMGCLVLGLWLLQAGHRHESYAAFAAGIGAIVASLSVKSIGTAAVGGDGLRNGAANLLTDRKPGVPPEPQP